MQKIKFVASANAEAVSSAKVQKSLLGTTFRHGLKIRLVKPEWVEQADTDSDEIRVFPTFEVVLLKSDGSEGRHEHLFLSNLVREIYNFDAEIVEATEAVTLDCQALYIDAVSDEEALTLIFEKYKDKTLVCDRTLTYEARSWDRKHECWSDKPTKRSFLQFKVAE